MWPKNDYDDKMCAGVNFWSFIWGCSLGIPVGAGLLWLIVLIFAG